MSAVNQALHGYREGHRMLAASIDLSAADRQRIAIQTDNSDAGRTKGWEALLAGYPLPSGLYAWSMTWPAPEMPRPGCVWSHTLLLDPAEHPFSSPDEILHCFSRPQVDIDPSIYSRPLIAQRPLVHLEPRRPPKGGVAFLAALLWSYYEPPLRSVRAAGIRWSDKERHTVMLSIWLQQWGALRAASSFTDAPITPRRLDERTSYDLQLHSDSRVQQRRETERVLAGVPTERSPEWATFAARDLLDQNGLSEFLHAYGPELGAERGAFSALCEIWVAETAQDPRGVNTLFSALTSLYPSLNAGVRLKHDLLDPGTPLTGCESEFASDSLLLAMLELKEVSALPLEDLQLDRRLTAILKDDPHQMSRIVDVIYRGSNPLGAAILDHLAGLRTKQQVRWLVDNPRSAGKLISMRPELAGSAQLWQRVDSEILWAALVGLRGKGKREVAVAAMLDSDAGVEPADVLHAWGGSEVLVLNLLASSPPAKKTADRWLAALPKRSIAGWVNANFNNVNQAALRLVLGILGPQELRSVDPHVVSRYLEASKAQDFTAKAFVAAVLSAADPRWAPVGVQSFERLCRAKGSQTSGPVSRYLEELDPSWVNSDSSNDRLARALNLAFQEDCWDPLAALELGQFAFRRLIAADKKAGLARRMLDAGHEQPDVFKKWQSAALIENVEARADRASLVGLLKRFWPF